MHPRLVRIAALGALSVSAFVPWRAQAQIVTPRTVPVQQNDQFGIFPTALGGMASVRIAVNDSTGDPFVNPAKATRVTQGILFGAPYFHRISNARGGGQTMTIGAIAPMGKWAASGVVSLQQLQRVSSSFVSFSSFAPFESGVSDDHAVNQYVAANLARRFDNGISAGVGMYASRLRAVDGVDLLYAGSDRIGQTGGQFDIRAGLTKDWGKERTFEVLILHNRYSMTHDVHYTTFVFDTMLRQGVRRERQEKNEDRTRIAGLHAQYVQPVGTSGWKVGWLATVNHLSHPKIPNYALQNIPRDPGGTNAFNLGIGAARTMGSSTFGLDVIYEPMFADTWADAARDTTIVGGGVIKAGQRTVDNSFSFSNAHLRFGFAHDEELNAAEKTTLGFQFGLGVYAINYQLKQANHVQRTFRTQDEGWIEWSPTLGLKYGGKDLQVQYVFQLTCGVRGCPGGEQRSFVGIADVGILTSSGGIIAAPSAPLTFDGGSSKMHKLIFSIPLR